MSPLFGILGNYLTKNVLNLNSAAIGSKRTAIGNPENDRLDSYKLIQHHNHAFNHYQILDIDEIKVRVIN